MGWALFLVTAGYVMLIRWVYAVWAGTRDAAVTDTNLLPGISVIIAVRNEENNIVSCLHSIRQNDYPSDKYEILLINDHSADNTVTCALDCGIENLRILSLPEGQTGKKAAITAGLSAAVYDHVLFTDGDCNVGNGWIKSHALQMQASGKSFLTGIVLPEPDGSMLADFQWMDFAMTMAVTVSGISRSRFFLANGANMSFTLTATKGLSEGKGSAFASGDDVFLIQALAEKSPGSIGVIKAKEAMVITKSEKSWQDFLLQRTRWATKSLKTSDTLVKIIQAFVFIVNLLMAVFVIAGILMPFKFGIYGLALPGVKAATDYLMLRSLARYYDNTKVMRSFVPSFFLYTAYILYAGAMALFPSEYIWKGRKVK